MDSSDRKPAAESERRCMEPTDALWLLAAFSDLHQKPLDAAALARECVPPLSLATFVELASRLEFNAHVLSARQIEALQPPLALEVHCRETESTQDQPSPRCVEGRSSWLLLLRWEAGDAFCVERGASHPRRFSVQELRERMTGVVIEVKPTPPRASDPDVPAAAKKSFGFGWFVPELLKYKGLWREILLASLVLQLIALAFPLFTQAIIDKVVVHRTQSTLIALAVGMAVFIIFTSVLTWIRQYLVLHTGNRVDAVLGAHVFEHLFRLPPLYFQHRPTGVIAARLQGIETIREFVSSAAVTLMLDFPFLLIFLGVMFWYSVKLTLVVLAVLALIVAASALVAPLFQRRLNEQFLRGAANQAFLTEYVAGIETVKSLQIEPQLNRRYRDLLAAFLTTSFRVRQLGNAYSTLSSGLEQVMSLLVLVMGAWMVMTSESFTVGMLVAFQMFSSRLSQPMLRLVGLWQQFQQARIAVTRLGDVMNAPPEPYSLAQSRPQGGKGAVTIQDLSFRYGDNLPLLYDGFNATIPAGQAVVIVGPSGSGKSTLAKLLQGFYQPTSGSIQIDNVDIRYLSANELRSNFGVVPQEITLFSGTILDNLRLANPFAAFEQIVAACRMAEVHTVIEALPNGYQTEIGERGAGLSGGQRQRLSIARALLKGPKILIFDEATSSVDVQTAEQLGRTINALKGKVTILFVAHVLPRTLQPDQIIRIGEKLSVVPSEKRAEHPTPQAEQGAVS